MSAAEGVEKYECFVSCEKLFAVVSVLELSRLRALHAISLSACAENKF